jgi:hypothetical protein
MMNDMAREPDIVSTVLVASYPNTVISMVLMVLPDQQYSFRQIGMTLIEIVLI